MIEAKGLGEVARDYVNREHMRPVYAGIDNATWPWKLRPIVFQKMFAVGEFEDCVLVEGRLGKDPGQIFRLKKLIPRDLSIEPDQIAAMLVDEFTQSFRRWRKEPESNIILGDN